jgi:hypothetical protein
MRSVLATLFLLLGACARTSSPTLVIQGATLVDVTDGSLRAEQTVLIAGNRIVAIGQTREVSIPDDAELVDAAGAYLIPGLWDMHVHSVANVSRDTAVESVVARDWHFPLFLAFGVTGVRVMNDGTGDVTLKLTNSTRRRLAEGDLSGPVRFFAAGPSVDGDPPLGSNAIVVRTAAEARAAVEDLASNGADLIKVYENLSRDASATRGGSAPWSPTVGSTAGLTSTDFLRGRSLESTTARSKRLQPTAADAIMSRRGLPAAAEDEAGAETPHRQAPVANGETDLGRSEPHEATPGTSVRGGRRCDECRPLRQCGAPTADASTDGHKP